MILSSACGVVGLHPILVGVRLSMWMFTWRNWSGFQEQVRRVLDIEKHRGCSGAVLVPEDEERTDRNIQTVANGHLQVTSPVSV